MQISVSLDWLRYSAPSGYSIANMIPETMSIDKETEIEPLPHYTHAAKLEPAGRADWNETNEKQGSLVTFGGKDLIDIKKAGLEPSYIVSYIHHKKWCRASRIDIAIDVLGRVAHPLDLLDAWNNGDIETHAQKCQAIEGYRADGTKTGETIYIGSRTSDTFLRVYDKGAEQRSNELWTRIELELKKTQARAAQGKIAALGVAAVASGKLRDFIKVKNVGWWSDMLYELPKSENFLQGKRKQEQSGSEKWLYEQALKAVCAAIEKGDEYCRDQVLMSLINRSKNSDSFTTEVE